MSRPQLSTQAFLQHLPAPVTMTLSHFFHAWGSSFFQRGEGALGTDACQDWLQMDAHFFMRPNLASLVMVDLDDHDGSLQDVLSLAPRALVQTSPRCFQIWYTLDQRFAASDAATVTRELTQILGGDTRSARTTQVGRMPGSINRKPQKMAPAMLLHSCLQNLNEAQYLHMVRPPLLRLQGGGVHVGSQRQARGG